MRIFFCRGGGVGEGNILFMLYKIIVRSVAVLMTAGAACAAPDLAPVKAWIAKQAGIKSLIVDIRQERHLRTVKKPLESMGRFHFVQGGAFRWQAGDPPKLVVVMSPQEELSVIYPQKKSAEVFSKTALEREDAGQGIAFLRAGFPTSLEEFLKRFEVTEVTVADGWDVVSVKPAGGGASFAVRKLVLAINQKTHRLGSMQIHLRDGSWMNNTVTGIQENPVIPAAQFSYDLTGFNVKRK